MPGVPSRSEAWHTCGRARKHTGHRKLCVLSVQRPLPATLLTVRHSYYCARGAGSPGRHGTRLAAGVVGQDGLGEPEARTHLRGSTCRPLRASASPDALITMASASKRYTARLLQKSHELTGHGRAEADCCLTGPIRALHRPNPWICAVFCKSNLAARSLCKAMAQGCGRCARQRRVEAALCTF